MTQKSFGCFSNLCKFEVFERTRHQEPFVNLVLQAVYLCSKHRSWVLSGFVIFDNRLLRDSQAPNGRLTGNQLFWYICPASIGRPKGITRGIECTIDLQNPRATQPIGLDPTRSPRPHGSTTPPMPATERSEQRIPKRNNLANQKNLVRGLQQRNLT